MRVFARRVKIVVKYFLTLKMMREQSEHVIIIDKRKSQQKDYDKNLKKNNTCVNFKLMLCCRV